MPSLALLVAVSLAGAPSEFAVDGRVLTSLEEAKTAMPHYVAARVEENVKKLGSVAADAQFHYFSRPADLLVVSTLGASRTAEMEEKILAACACIHRLLVEDAGGDGHLPQPRSGVPWGSLALSVSPRVVRYSSQPAAAVVRSSTVSDMAGEPVVGALFDVRTTYGTIMAGDEDSEREGVQVSTDAQGRIDFVVRALTDGPARIGVVRVESVDNPTLSAVTEVHFCVWGTDEPYFPTVYLLNDSSVEYRTVVDYLNVAYPQAGLRVIRPDATEKNLKTLSATYFLCPQIVVVPDRKPSASMQVWRTINNVVHEIVHPIVWSYYGPLPYWLDEGIAWYVEHLVCGSVYGFCAYSGFVYDEDHANWTAKAKPLLKKPDSLDLRAVLAYKGELDRKRPGMTVSEPTFDIRRMVLGHVLLRYLIEDHDRNLEFRRFILRVATAQPEPSVDAQIEWLRAAFGPKLEENVGTFTSKLAGEAGPAAR